MKVACSQAPPNFLSFEVFHAWGEQGIHKHSFVVPSVSISQWMLSMQECPGNNAKCYYIHVLFLTTRNQRLQENCFDLPPCSTRETTVKAKQHQSPELTTTLSEYELSLYELPTPSNKRVVPDNTLLKMDLESSFASVKESFNTSTVMANQTGCKRKVGEWTITQSEFYMPDLVCINLPHAVLH